MKKFLCLLILLFTNNLFAEQNIFIHEGGTAQLLPGTFDSKHNKIIVGISHNLFANWHISWKDPGDTAFPMQIHWHESKNIKSLKVLWPIPEKKISYINSNTYIINNLYNDNVILPIIITAIDPKEPVIFNAKISFSICKDHCNIVDFQSHFSLDPDFSNKDNLAKINEYINKVPVNIKMLADSISVKKHHIAMINEQEGIINLELDFHKNDLDNSNNIFINSFNLASFSLPISNISDNILEIQIPFKLDLNKKPSQLKDIEIVIKNDNYNFLINAQEYPAIITMANNDINNDYSIQLILIFAIIGGLILNIMPCVLPVLILKLMAILKANNNDKHRGRIGLLISSLGIIFSFGILALIVIGLQAGSNNIGWGFHFQSPTFIIALIVIIMIFTILIRYDISLPIPNFVNKIPIASNRYIRDFMNGMLATTLATPCTAPFLGTAVAFAFTTRPELLFLIFILIGFGMALPYIIFALFPTMIKILPKPGPWMHKVKEILALTLLLTAFWLMWVLYKQIGLTAILLLTIHLILIKLILLKKVINHKIISKILLLVIIISSFVTTKMVGEYNIKRYDYADSVWIDFNEEDITKYIGAGKIVFVDVTADWCLTCQTNKFLVLNDTKMLDIFARKDIIAMRADWTNRSDKILNFMKKHQSYGVPLNIVFGPNNPQGIKLSTLLSDEEVITAINDSSCHIIID